jgi:hypothetical protein
VLSLPQQPALVQFVGLVPRTRFSEEYGGGTSGGSLAAFLPQMETVASHYQVSQNEKKEIERKRLLTLATAAKAAGFVSEQWAAQKC